MSIDKGKAKKILSRTFLDLAKDLNEDEAKDKIFASLTLIKQLKEERESDDKLAAASQIVKDLKSGYNSAIKNEEAKISHLRDHIEELQGGTDFLDELED